MTNQNSSRILFFDDYPLHSENSLFLNRLRRRLGPFSPVIEVVKTIRTVEELLVKETFSLAILDIMAQVPKSFRRHDDNSRPVSSALAGVEVLRRIRSNYYGERNSEMPIFMRTARGEAYIRRLCSEAGATGYFLAGVQDGRLISAIQGYLE